MRGPATSPSSRARAAAPKPQPAGDERSLPCPRCETRSLIEVERDGVTIDRCRRCRGIWLDRGELEHLLAQARDEQRLVDDDETRPLDLGPRAAGNDRRDDDDDDSPRRRARRSWWDIFD